MEAIAYTFILFLTLGVLFFAIAFRETPKITKK
ncbi:photosystem II reaction center protein T [Synechococcus sp. Nb3U1]|jgi:photosystem II PsbT protein|nr:photosystem II reaction center protein T [Synechococcus sp. Nb3U1]MCF2971417.1 photosystem II reaction center protein T [Synechococcus sp. Nb3U1]